MQWMSEATTATFMREVIERSRRDIVVLVDFWAEWCAPCRVLGPVLEQAVEARGGAAHLVKVNTDQSPELSQQLGIRSIPTVKVFAGGRIVDEFVGARDRRFVDALLDRLCPPAEERALKQAEALLAEGEVDQVEVALGPALASPHHEETARLVLARARIVAGQLPAAREALAAIPPQSLVADQARTVLAWIDLLQAAQGTREATERALLAARPGDSDARWRLAGTLVAARKHREALEELLELLQRDRRFREDGARRAMIAIFDLLGPGHDLAREFRRRMQIYL